MKALAIDLDGTLLGPDGEMSERNRRALLDARKAGYEIILATARWYQLAEPVAEALELSGPVIACQGAEVRRLPQGVDLLDLRLPKGFSEQLLELCDAMRCIAWMAMDDEVLAKADGEIEDLPRGARQVNRLSGQAGGPPRVALIQGSGISRAIREQLAPRWERDVRFVTSISVYGKPILTLTSAQANKGLALNRACEDLRITPAEVIAFGDAENDIELFEAAGYSFAMGQAEQSVQEAASAVAPRHDEDGVGQTVERLLREGDAFLDRALP